MSIFMFVPALIDKKVDITKIPETRFVFTKTKTYFSFFADDNFMVIDEKVPVELIDKNHERRIRTENFQIETHGYDSIVSARMKNGITYESKTTKVNDSERILSILRYNKFLPKECLNSIPDGYYVQTVKNKYMTHEHINYHFTHIMLKKHKLEQPLYIPYKEEMKGELTHE